MQPCTQCGAAVEPSRPWPRPQHPDWCRRCRRREHKRRCYQTKKYRERLRRYRQTERYRENRRRYRQTEEYRESRRLYRRTVRESQQPHRHTEKYRDYHREYMRRYFQTDAGRERRRQAVRRYFRKNPHKKKEGHALRRARKRNATIIELVDRMVIFDLDGGLCHLCGTTAEPDSFQLDHLIPLSVEPIEAAWNYAVTHPSCNYQKGGHLNDPVLSCTVRARWQQYRPNHLAQLDAALMMLRRRDAA